MAAPLSGSRIAISSSGLHWIGLAHQVYIVITWPRSQLQVLFKVMSAFASGSGWTAMRQLHIRLAVIPLETLIGTRIHYVAGHETSPYFIGQAEKKYLLLVSVQTPGSSCSALNLIFKGRKYI